MKSKKQQKKLLHYMLIGNIIVLIPLFLRKPQIKDWFIVYVFNAATNSIIDNVLTKKKIVKYPIKLFPKIFDTHVLFDLFLYPTFTVLYNQISYKDKPLTMLYKLLLMSIPAFMIEIWAEKKTNLITWSKQWKWYYSFLSILLKSLFTRCVIEGIRKINAKKSENI